MSAEGGNEPTADLSERLHLRRWTAAPVVSLGMVALAAGFGQFGVVAALGDVAKAYGKVPHGVSLNTQVGLSATVIGVGLAVIRLASLAGLPLAGIADRFGRRAVIAGSCSAGLALTACAAASPSYWWFVAIFALGRPALSATVALAQVGAAELTSARDRSAAVALIAAGYAVGGGMTAIIHGLAGTTFGFRGVMALALVPLAGVVLLARRIPEPDRFVVEARHVTRAMPVIGAVARAYLPRFGVVFAIAFSVSVISGPANSYIFLYAQNDLHLAGTVTSAMVLAAGAVGLGGLLAGRWSADHVGRRTTAVIGLLGIATFGTLAYTGTPVALVTGYVLGIFAGAIYAPAAGALTNELFPTRVRASIAGWLVAGGVLGAVTGLLAFGAIAGAANHFRNAAVLLFPPAALPALLYFAVPETRGREPEDLWPGELPPAPGTTAHG